jgi:hypothetical protein
MKRAYAAVVAAALAAAAVPIVAHAQEQTDPDAKAEFVGAIKVGKKKATLKVTYSCNAGQALWVSPKQSALGKKDRRLRKEGSSKAASAWWQSHRNTFVCDTQPHTARFSIDKVEKGSKGKLKDGTAWVQFCVTNGDDLVLSGSHWVRVRA